MTLTQAETEKLRHAYRPATVRVLFVGESPPAGGSFFYLGNSHLVRYTREAFPRVHGEYESMDQFIAGGSQMPLRYVDAAKVANEGCGRVPRATRRRW